MLTIYRLGEFCLVEEFIREGLLLTDLFCGIPHSWWQYCPPLRHFEEITERSPPSPSFISSFVHFLSGQLWSRRHYQATFGHPTYALHNLVKQALQNLCKSKMGPTQLLSLDHWATVIHWKVTTHVLRSIQITLWAGVTFWNWKGFSAVKRTRKHRWWQTLRPVVFQPHLKIHQFIKPHRHCNNFLTNDAIQTRRGSPVDSRPSTDWFKNFVRKQNWHVTPDTWHLTPDTRHLKSSTWHVTREHEPSFKILTSWLLGYGIESGIDF